MASFTSLAEEILAQARKMDSLLEENNIRYPSFNEDTLEALPQDAQQTRRHLLDISHNFRQLVRGARLSGHDLAYNWTEQLILRIIWRYKLASAVPLQGTASYDDIASTSGLSRSVVVRTLRAAIPLRIFDEPERGRISHTAISRLMAEDSGYNSALGLQAEDVAPASAKLIEAWEAFGDEAAEPDQSAFSFANGGKSLFTVLGQDAERALRFDLAMKYYIEEKDSEFFDIVKAFDWRLLDQPGSRLVDLGGGYGQTSQTLAKHTKNMTFTVQDLPHVARGGREALPPALSSRIDFEGHSFMDLQRAENPPEAFLIGRCLHNWSDPYASIILRALIPALRRGSKVLIWDSVISEEPVKNFSERFNLVQDLVMATIFNGKDRTVAEFRALLEMSDPRFAIERVTQPEGCNVSMLEVTWDA